MPLTWHDPWGSCRLNRMLLDLNRTQEGAPPERPDQQKQPHEVDSCPSPENNI